MKERIKISKVQTAQMEIAEIVADLEGIRSRLRKILAELPQEYPEAMRLGRMAASEEYRLSCAAQAAVEQVTGLIRRLRPLVTLTEADVRAEWEQRQEAKAVAEVCETFRRIASRVAEAEDIDLAEIASWN